MVTFPPGSAPDIIARLAGQHLSDRLGQQFVIENKPGAGGNLATEYVAKAEPDGYTILMPVSTNAVNVALYRNLNFDSYAISHRSPASPKLPSSSSCRHRSQPRRCPSSLLSSRPIPARSTWARPVSEARRMSAASCSS